MTTDLGRIVAQQPASSAPLHLSLLCCWCWCQLRSLCQVHVETPWLLSPAEHRNMTVRRDGSRSQTLQILNHARISERTSSSRSSLIVDCNSALSRATVVFWAMDSQPSIRTARSNRAAGGFRRDSSKGIFSIAGLQCHRDNVTGPFVGTDAELHRRV